MSDNGEVLNCSDEDLKGTGQKQGARATGFVGFIAL